MRPELENALRIAPGLTPEEAVRLLVDFAVAVLQRLNAGAAAPREDSPSLLTVAEAARHIRMSEKWIYRNRASLPVLRIGNGNGGRAALRFRRRDLDAWLKQHEAQRERR